MEEQLGRAPTVNELATHLEISPRKAAAISHAIRACTCPSQAGTAEDGSSVTDSLPDTRVPQPFEAVFSESDADFVSRMLSRITDREALVLKLRYGLSERNGKRMTLKQIGDEVGLTRERVRQIEREAKRKLEEYIEEYP